MRLTRSTIFCNTMSLFALLAMKDAPVRTGPGFYRWMLGSFEVTVLSDGGVTTPFAAIRTWTRSEEFSAKVETSINAFLIHTGERLLLVDAGAGNVFLDGRGIVQSLRAAGWLPEDAADVPVTHIRGGHTPEHTFFSIESEGRQLVLWGDPSHAMDVQFHRRNTAIPYDVDEEAAEKPREAALADAAAKGYLVGAAHVSFPGIGRVAADGSSYVRLPVNHGKAGPGRPADKQ